MAANVKVPRKKIPWSPIIGSDACIYEKECEEFSKNNVFDWNDALGVSEVNRSYNCVVGCDACAKICPSEAISFPPMDEFRVTLRKLMAEANREAEKVRQEQPSGAAQPR